jgi:tryptophanyl-tRNA synthetase
MEKLRIPRLVSGIQPSGRLHIGNYLGALKNFVNLQEEGGYDCLFFVADLHSLTEDFDPQKKREQIFSLTADFLAAGLDPKKSTIFLQSLVPAHSELMWMLNTITPMGELSRMTQFKDKGGVLRMVSTYTAKEGTLNIPDERQNSETNVGLFDYPVLMAADILLYSAGVVPVGNDQDQHLELTRTLARKFNRKFDEVFVEPKPLHTPLPRVMSLDDPSKKMSKSRPEGCLFVDDEPEAIEKKIKRAVTDSGSEVKGGQDKPALNNLLSIYSNLSGKSIKEVEVEFSGRGYADFKKSMTEVICEYFENFRNTKAKLMNKPSTLTKILEEGSAKASKLANKKLAEAKSAMGLGL